MHKYLARIVYLWRTGGIGLVLAAISAKVTGSPKLVSLRVPGSRISVVIRYPSSDLETFNKVLVMCEYSLDTVHEPRFIVDAGANIGLSAIYFALKFPEAKIFAVEPETENFKLLIQNISQFANVRAIHAALWSVSGFIHLDDPGRGAWGYCVGGLAANGSEKAIHSSKEISQAVDVLYLLEESKCDSIDILKLDVEGAEKELFTHSEPWINCVRAVVVELHERWVSGCAEAFYKATFDFPIRWEEGENTFASREGWLIPPASLSRVVDAE